MPKFFVNDKQFYSDKVEIFGEDVKHIANVLRKQIGDQINICNISTSENFLCQIDEINKEKIICRVLNKIENNVESNVDITIFQGLPKAEKMELIIQKCTELGANTFYPVQMERCVVKLDSKQEFKKIERWKKIVESAAKQSGRDKVPNVENVINLKELLNLLEKYDIVLLAYENEHKNTLKNELKQLKSTSKVAIIIGPEGGIDEKEVELLSSARSKSNNIRKSYFKN